MHVSIVNVCPASLHQSPLPSDKVFAPSRSDQKVDQLLMHNTAWQLVPIDDSNCSHHSPLTTQGYNILYDMLPDKISVKDLGTCRALPKSTRWKFKSDYFAIVIDRQSAFESLRLS